MLRNIKLAFVSSVLALLPVAACSSSSGSPSTPPGIYCDVTGASVPLCYGYSNLTPDQQNAVSMSCTSSLMGKVAGSCPAGDIGCCEQTTSGYTTTECYYTGDPSTYQQGCTAGMGTWTPGSSDGGTTGEGGMDAADSSSGDSGGGKDSGGDGGQCSKADTLCGKMCVNTNTDAKNCGKCGHACKTGMTCKTGVCK